MQKTYNAANESPSISIAGNYTSGLLDYLDALPVQPETAVGSHIDEVTVKKVCDVCNHDTENAQGCGRLLVCLPNIL